MQEFELFTFEHIKQHSEETLHLGYLRVLTSPLLANAMDHWIVS